MKVHSTISGGPATLDMLDGLPQELAFPVEEYQARLAAVRDGMSERDIEVLLVQHPTNVLYLTGYQTFSPNFGECMIVPQEGDPTLLALSPELGGALVHTWLDDRRGYPPDRSRERYVAETLREKHLDAAKVGVEKSSHGVPASDVRRPCCRSSEGAVHRRVGHRRGGQDGEVATGDRAHPRCRQDDGSGHGGGYRRGPRGSDRQRHGGRRVGGVDSGGQRVYVPLARRDVGQAFRHPPLNTQAQPPRNRGCCPAGNGRLHSPVHGADDADGLHRRDRPRRRDEWRRPVWSRWATS